jgi:ArsR family transcriptional regulator
MKLKTKNDYAAQAALIKAMAHPTRLLILTSLNNKKTCVCELRDLVGDDLSTISKHLSVLKNAGLVEIERRGNKIFYSLKCPCVLNFITCVTDLKGK